jgi:neutral ceramidase
VIARIVALAALLLALAAGPAGAAGLRAGAGRADITPPTGYFMMGWVRGDAVLQGAHTRLYARAIVLERDGRKVALVAADLGAIPGGVVVQAGEALRDRGFSETNILVSASHTHAAPTGIYNFPTYNTVFMTSGTPTSQNVGGELDPQLYAFMVRQVTEAIRRADDDLAPAAAAWGRTRLLGITANRSLEAHLANHGIIKDWGAASVADDPYDYAETIDPNVTVLRVDKVLRRGRRRPIGMWSTFANHGTVNPATFTVANADHHGAATRVVERTLRRSGKVPASQEVVDAFGNTDEGDMSSGLDRRGPAWAEEVGRREADAFLRAWRSAGRRLSRTPELDLRWTRVCFCGQEVEGGRVGDQAVVGLPLITGSEEGRGPLYDITHEHFEGRTSPIDAGAQGHKIQILPDFSAGTPKAVPLLAVRVGDELVVSVPGEMTEAMGRRVREAVSAATGLSAVISGLANEYLSYFTSPEEYDRQHYEGGSTMYGRLSSNLLKGSLTDLAARLVHGQPAPEPYAYDSTNGVTADAAPFPPGPESAGALEQPRDVERLAQATFAWQGGERGYDRPVGRAFVTVERRVKKRWRLHSDDLGLQIVWRVDDSARYEAHWEVPHTAPAGKYRFVVTGNRYRLESSPFAVRRTDDLAVVRRAGAGSVRVRLAYPRHDDDLTWRPAFARGGRVTFSVDGRRKRVRSRGLTFSLKAPRGASVTVPAGGARDRYGNTNADALPAGPVD